MIMTDNGPMTAEQAATLKRLAKDAYELDAYKPNLTRAEADKRIGRQYRKAGRAPGRRAVHQAQEFREGPRRHDPFRGAEAGD